MNALDQALRRIAAYLDQRRVGWALVGGFAVSARAEPRFTRHVDLAVAVADDHAAEDLVQSLLADGYRVLATVEQDNVGRLATVRLASPHGGVGDVVADLLFASSGIEREVVQAAEQIAVVEDFELPVANVGHLIALKLLSQDDVIRPQDSADLRALLAEARASDIGEARSAVALISQRGYGRERDLAATLEDMLGHPRST